MFKKILACWISALAAFFSRWLFSTKPPPNDLALNMLDEAVLRYDAAGKLIYANSAAEALGALENLRYPSGQAVPRGEAIVRRVLRTGQAIQGAEYLVITDAGETRLIEVTAALAPGTTSVAAVIRDITERRNFEAREKAEARRHSLLTDLSRRLSALDDDVKINTAIVEAVRALAAHLPDVRVQLFAFKNTDTPLALIASSPNERPPRPRSLRESAPTTIPFDATSPLLWQLYVSRQPVKSARELHLPLVSGPAAIGHLSLFATAASSFEDEQIVETLTLLTGIAALARSRILAEQIQQQRQQELAALQAVGQSVTAAPDWDALADVASKQVLAVLGDAVCILAVFEARGKKRLRVRGTCFRDALLFPESDPAELCDAAVRESAETGQSVMRVGLPNLPLDGSPWRMFAGQSGQHSILSVPLKHGAEIKGALTVYLPIEAGFSPTQIGFVETLAALLINRG